MIPGKDLHNFTLKDREHLGVVLSDSGFSGYLTIKDIIPVLRNLYKGFEYSFFVEQIHRFGLPMDIKIKDFSTGMKAKLKVLTHSILISSHISSDLETLCDDIYMIHNGKVILHEDTDILLSDYVLLKVEEEQFCKMEKQYILRSQKETYGYSCLTNVLSLFTLSTISYDEFDNGNAFLFTLPISRAGYAVEKYCLALLLGGGAWVLAIFFAMVIAIVRGTVSVSDIAMTAVMILPALIVIQAVMIPFQLKFGGEKGRSALIGAVGLLFVIGIVAVF